MSSVYGDGAMQAPASVQHKTIFWGRSLLWLLFLGPFFFISYGFANEWAANVASPGVLVFDWEQRTPFVPWTIVPYWSIDLLYGLSFLLCRSRREVDIHAMRLLSVQLISISCFVLFPLHFSFQRPPADGVFGWMFAVLMGFDQPFNQAPSLHIGLLVVLWVRYAAATRGLLRFFTHIWACLIGISVLTTYQHHFIDLPTGALVGLLCVWLWPDRFPSPVLRWHVTPLARGRKLGALYLAGALLCCLGARTGGVALWLLWPAVSLTLVGLNYLVIGPVGFQKYAGRLSAASFWLLAPYTLGAWINSRLWTSNSPRMVEIAAGVFLGRTPGADDIRTRGVSVIVDCAAELPVPAGDWLTVSHPWLDLVPPDVRQLQQVAEQIEKRDPHTRMLVCCALGYSRSALAIAAWLLMSGRAHSVDEAIARIRQQRPQIVLGAAHQKVLGELIALQAGHSSHAGEAQGQHA